MSNGLFLYFFAGWEQGSATRERLLTTPLKTVAFDALRNDRTFKDMVVQHFVSNGPSGSSGVLVAVRHPAWPDAHRLGYYPEEQTWRDCGDDWLGYVTNCKPGPDSLQREALVSGYDYELGDENIWHAPMIRYPAGSANLPQTMGVDASGKYVESVVATLTWAWELACKIWDDYFLGSGITRSEVFGYAVQCLALNYRIGLHEATALGLFDTDTSGLILKAAIAEPLIREFMAEEESKKNQVAAAP